MAMPLPLRWIPAVAFLGLALGGSSGSGGPRTGPRTSVGPSATSPEAVSARLLSFVLANGAKHMPAGDVQTWYSSAAMPQLGVVEAARAFPALRANATPWVDALLDSFLRPGAPAAAGIAGARWHNWCDMDGVPPAVFAAAARSNASHPKGMQVVRAFAAQALNYPHNGGVDGLASLPGGAVARSTSGGWRVPALPRQNATQITWPDDCFMCTAALSHAAPVLGEAALLDEAARRLLAVFRSGQRDAADGLLWHGYDVLTGGHSCCKWGDGNGWMFMALADTVKGYVLINRTVAAALEGPSRQLHAEAAAALRQVAAAWIAAQDPGSGLWHQLMDDNTTFLSSSAAGFGLYALAAGIQAGVLARAATWPHVAKGWASLAGRVVEDGFVTGLSDGFGINGDRAEYLRRDNNSLLWGYGAVLRAAAIVGAQHAGTPQL